MRVLSTVSSRTRAGCWVALLAGVVWLGGCADSAEVDDVAETTEADVVDPTGCPPGDAACRAAFVEAYGCFPFNGNWTGRWEESTGFLGGPIFATIEVDGCEAVGTAIFEDAPCFNQADFNAVAEGQSIEGRVTGVESGNRPVEVAIEGEGADDEIELRFSVLQSVFCRNLTGTIRLER